MKRSLARLRWAGLGVVWDAADPEPERLLAVAETVALPPQVVHVHYHLHISPGTDPAAVAQALSFIPAVPQPRAAITTATQEVRPCGD